VGFIFGSVKANPWWNTALMPLIFLISGIVSGIALILLLYFIVSKVRNEVVDNSCVESLSSFLLLFLTIGISLELLEIAHFMYLQEEGVEIISELITQKLFASFALQLGVGGLLPIVILFCGKFSRSTDIKKAVYTLSSLLVLIGVFSMRWNVIIGGQLISKSLRGFADYHIQIFGQEGLITAITALAIPFFILWVLAKIFPLKEA
jgi:formate-dependent nitrite reductase membrane component NrfD